MRVVVGVCVVSIAFFSAYLRYIDGKTTVMLSRCYLALSQELVHNNLNEMKPFYVIFEEVYSENIGKISVDSAEQAIDLIEKDVKNPELVYALKRYLSAGTAEINNAQSELLLSAEAGLRRAEKEFREKGKTYLALYPAIVAVLVIILI